MKRQKMTTIEKFLYEAYEKLRYDIKMSEMTLL